MTEQTDNARLKKLRQRIGISQAQAAKFGQVPYRTFCNWEVVSPHSSRPVPGMTIVCLELVDLLVNDLGMPLDQLEKVLQKKRAAIE